MFYKAVHCHWPHTHYHYRAFILLYCFYYLNERDKTKIETNIISWMTVSGPHPPPGQLTVQLTYSPFLGSEWANSLPGEASIIMQCRLKLPPTWLHNEVTKTSTTTDSSHWTCHLLNEWLVSRCNLWCYAQKCANNGHSGKLFCPDQLFTVKLHSLQAKPEYEM